MKELLKRSIPVILIMILLCSCEYYLGMNQQPKFVGEPVKEGLNIFGILRPDSIGEHNRSFVYVQQIWPVLENGDFGNMENTLVDIEKLSIADPDIINFPFTYPDEFFSDTLYRPVGSFFPKPGETYRMHCLHPDFEEALGKTTIPFPPQIIESTWYAEGNQVRFTIQGDSTISMVDVYLYNSDSHFPVARYQTGYASVDVNLDLPIDPGEYRLRIFSYDVNLSLYLGSANTSLNFNKYRLTISTLESGYGVFGSLNFADYIIPLTD